MAVECASGVDIEGPIDAVVVWDGPADTINLNAADVRVSGITVRHEGDDFFYALHCDAPGPGRVILDRVAAYSDSKSALGIGICAGQSLEARGCLFVRGERGRTSEPVLAHDMPDGSPGARVLLQDCYAYSHTGGPEAVWTSLAHGIPEPSPTLPSRWEPIAC